ncbi:hypothetical protein HY971_02130 [Candidatus Kaiserbacteria bacterium]|nr:hypothetical protein [Candidatus Kaiserbacteria bacterium]
MYYSRILLVSLVLGVAVFLGAYALLPHGTAVDDCLERPAPGKCLIEKAHLIAMTGDIRGALDYAVRVIAPYNRNVVHFAMHVIGHEAYEHIGNRAAALALLPPEASTNEHYLTYEGYQHGLLQFYLAAEKDNTSIDSLIKESCGEFYVPENTQTESFTWRARRQCFHAVGHALMYAYKNDLSQALPPCGRLPYEWMRDRCAYGVFMELSYLYDPSYSVGNESPYVVGDNMALVCEPLTDFKSQCAEFVGRSYFMSHKNDLKGAFKACAELSPPFDRTCRIDIAEIVITSSDDFAKLRQGCSAAGPQYELECLATVARAVQRGYAGEAARGKDFCASIESPLREQCKSESQKPAQ